MQGLYLAIEMPPLLLLSRPVSGSATPESRSFCANGLDLPKFSSQQVESGTELKEGAKPMQTLQPPQRSKTRATA